MSLGSRCVVGTSPAMTMRRSRSILSSPDSFRRPMQDARTSVSRTWSPSGNSPVPKDRGEGASRFPRAKDGENVRRTFSHLSTANSSGKHAADRFWLSHALPVTAPLPREWLPQNFRSRRRCGGRLGRGERGYRVRRPWRPALCRVLATVAATVSRS